jgi:multicomponent K+:H+ antiporter subunit D
MHLAAWSVFLPLIAGFVILFAKAKGLLWQRMINLLTVCGLVVLSTVLIVESAAGAHHVYLLGNWAAPFGIVLVLDKLSALMVAITSVLALAALIYAIAAKTDKRGAHFHVLFSLILFGLNGAFLTGDLFNLFVFFEVLLLASYVIINMVGATLFLFAVGALYGILGTLNIADMATKIAVLPEQDIGVVAAAGLLLLVVFGTKAALFPLYLWMPTAYSNTSAAVAALFAIMTKVGLYAIIRVHGTVFGTDAGALSFYYMPWLLGLGMITLILAAFGVMASRKLREQVAYLVLASIATMLIAVGLNSQLALSASLYYMIHSTLMAGGLFLLADIISRGRGTFKDRFESAYAMPGAILIGAMFMFGAVAMAGVPPLSGFFGKMLILDAALEHQWSSIVLAIILIASFLMIVSMARTGSLLFYDVLEPNQTEPDETQASQQDSTIETPNRVATITVIGLFALSPILVIFAKPITAYTESVAEQQFDSQRYVESVLSKQPVTAVEE